MTPKPNNRSEIVSLLFAVGIALVAAAPLLLNAGFLNTRAGGDSPFLLMRVHQLTAGLRDGVFPVRWMPDAAYGLGYPFFNYYAALPYYFAALLRLLGFSTVVSLKIVQLMGFVVAALGMYGWVRRITERAWTAALAAAAYTVTPFHLVNVYVRGDSLSEFWAMAWYPLILLSLHAAAERPTARRIALVGLAFGALVMTHNVSALLFAPFVAVYAVGCGLAHRKEPAPRTLLGLAAGGVLGLALAAWVWLPALAETGFVQLDEQTTGFFFYGTHFRTADLVQPRLLFDYAPADNPFSMGLVQAVLTGLGTAATAVRMVREQSWWRDGFLLGGLALSTLMITPLSEPLWANLPLLPFAQFPWRFLSVQALFTAAVTAALVDLFAGRTARIAAAVAPALLIGAAGLGALRLDFIGITEADITPQRLQWYEAFTGNIGTTIRYEYLPRWTQPRPYSSDILMGQPPRAKFLSGTGTAERVAVGVHRQTWRISVGEDAAIGLPVLYFPGWQARADGQRVALSPVEGVGYTRVDLPAGEHTVELRFGRTLPRWIGDLAALGGVGTVIALWRPRLRDWPWLWITGGVTTVIVWGMVATTLPPPEPDLAPLNADFAQRAYFYPGGLDPGGAAAALPPPPQVVQGGGVGSGAAFPAVTFDDPPTIRTGEPRSPTIYFAPPAISLPTAAARPDSGLHAVGPLTLHQVEMAGNRLQLVWSTDAELTQHYQIALRLNDQAGMLWAELDAPLGSAGLYPTGLWEPGLLVTDSYHLPGLEGLPPAAYALTITPYDAMTREPVGTAAVDVTTGMPVARCTDAVDLHAAEVTLPDVVTEQGGLQVDVAWGFVEPPDQDYRVRWLLGDAWQAETPLAVGSAPAEWTAAAGCGTLIRGRHRLDPPRELFGATYTLRFVLLDERGEPASAPVTAGEVALAGTPRVFSVPDGLTPAAVTFGEVVALRGFALRQAEDTLSVDIAWGAAAQMDTDYTYFVHLFDPATETIVAQIDSMPRAFTYPTSAWVEGEIVTETLTLDLSEVPPGSYRIAIGWYSDAGRLTPADAGGDPLPDGRVILDAVIAHD